MVRYHTCQLWNSVKKVVLLMLVKKIYSNIFIFYYNIVAYLWCFLVFSSLVSISHCIFLSIGLWFIFTFLLSICMLFFVTCFAILFLVAQSDNNNDRRVQVLELCCVALVLHLINFVWMVFSHFRSALYFICLDISFLIFSEV